MLFAWLCAEICIYVLCELQMVIFDFANLAILIEVLADFRETRWSDVWLMNSQLWDSINEYPQKMRNEGRSLLFPFQPVVFAVFRAKFSKESL